MRARRGGRIGPWVAACLVACLGAAGCGSVAADENDSGGTIEVVASTDVWASVVRAVGGPRVEVTAIIDASSGAPHGYRATARDAAEVLEADLVLYNGGGFDPFMPQLLAQAPVPGLVAVRASGHGRTGNEHVWYEPRAVGRVADAVADRLGELRPSAARTFRHNAHVFRAKLERLDARIAELAAAHAGSTVLSTSPVAHYLLSAAGLHNVAPSGLTEAVEEGNDIPVLTQQHVKELIEHGKVDVVVANTQTMTPVVEKLTDIADARGVPVTRVRETLPERFHEYLPWMNAQVQALAGALTRS